MKKTLVIALCLVLALTFVACAPQVQTPNEQSTDNPVAEIPEQTAAPMVEISIADYGTITVELDPTAAPITVENFLKLVNDGFYDGLTFHRIIDGFMMQGGDPEGNGTGGSDTKIKGEFSSNGVDNPLKHTAGAISMARNPSGADTASSQFFIMDVDYPSLDGDYACFGYVSEGMDIVTQICDDSVGIAGQDGGLPAENQPVIEYIKQI